MIPTAQHALKRTLSELEAQKANTERQIRAIKQALAALGGPSSKLANRRKRRPMDAAERRAVSKRMKAYWARKKRQAK